MAPGPETTQPTTDDIGSGLDRDEELSVLFGDGQDGGAAPIPTTRSQPYYRQKFFSSSPREVNDIRAGVGTGIVMVEGTSATLTVNMAPKN